MSGSDAKAAFDDLAGLDGWRGFVDPWDKADGTSYAEWMRDESEPTCLDCGRCEVMEGDLDEKVRAALGFGLGFCLEFNAWVTDRCTVEELGNGGEGGCFGRRW